MASSIFPVPTYVSSARIQHAFVNMNIDAIHPARGASQEDIRSHLRKRAAASSPVVDSLWNANQDLVSQFLNNNFTTTCARSSDQDCLPIYQKYSVQDYFFLVDYIKYKAHRVISVPEYDLAGLQAEVASVASDTEYAVSFAQSYVTDLHGATTDLKEANRGLAELAYGNVLQNAAGEDDWYDLHVLSIPCIYGWTRLAEKLQDDPQTKNDTIFYNTWIKPNTDPSFANNLTAFLNANEAVWKAGIDTTGSGDVTGRWNSLFRTAMKLEIALFASVFNE